MATRRVCKEGIDLYKMTGGCQKKITKEEFANLMLKHAPGVDEIPDGWHLVVDLPDGSALDYFHVVWPENVARNEGLQHEWAVHWKSLKPRTRLRRTFERDGWLYIAPYNNPGYKIDPSGKWSYLVWK
jgi:hypothetical protein